MLLVDERPNLLTPVDAVRVAKFLILLARLKGAADDPAPHLVSTDNCIPQWTDGCRATAPTSDHCWSAMGRP
jgi:hypothetical protein